MIARVFCMFGMGFNVCAICVHAMEGNVSGIFASLLALACFVLAYAATRPGQ